jgi:hypothetical protein
MVYAALPSVSSLHHKNKTGVMKIKKEKKWTDNQEIELERCYLTLQMDMKALKERFNCSTAEIRLKLKELGAWQGY